MNADNVCQLPARTRSNSGWTCFQCNNSKGMLCCTKRIFMKFKTWMLISKKLCIIYKFHGNTFLDNWCVTTRTEKVTIQHICHIISNLEWYLVASDSWQFILSSYKKALQIHLNTSYHQFRFPVNKQFLDCGLLHTLWTCNMVVYTNRLIVRCQINFSQQASSVCDTVIGGHVTFSCQEHAKQACHGDGTNSG